MADAKVNYSPPGWLVTWFDQVRLDPVRAQKFNDLRAKLCEGLGEDHKDYPMVSSNALWMKALDLLLEHESELLEQVKAVKESK